MCDQGDYVQGRLGIHTSMWHAMLTEWNRKNHMTTWFSQYVQNKNSTKSLQINLSKAIMAKNIKYSLFKRGMLFPQPSARTESSDEPNEMKMAQRQSRWALFNSLWKRFPGNKCAQLFSIHFGRAQTFQPLAVDSVFFEPQCRALDICEWGTTWHLLPG